MPPPRLLVLQHHATSPPGLVGERMAARGAAVTLLDAEHGCVLPADAARFDGLVILGGVVDAYADAACSHFPVLLDLIRHFGEVERPVLGLCLGGQLVARALGAKVHLGSTPEFGFVDLAATGEGEADPLVRHARAGLPVMQWHDDSFDLPGGATLLLQGDRCRNQGFRWGRSVYSFQCHLEVTPAIAAEWGRLRGEESNNPAVRVRLGAEIVRHGERAATFGRKVADAWLDLVDSGR
jgi:GMP synthase-like glutamine amidotransferase